MFPNLFCHFAPQPTLEVIKNENKQSASNRKKSIYVGYKWVQMNVKAIKLIQVTEINLMSVQKYRWEYSGVYCNVPVDICAKVNRPPGMPLKDIDLNATCYRIWDWRYESKMFRLWWNNKIFGICNK